MVEVNMEWNMICRVCLQEGDMVSVYEKDETSVSYGEKIMLCSAIVVSIHPFIDHHHKIT